MLSIFHQTDMNINLFNKLRKYLFKKNVSIYVLLRFGLSIILLSRVSLMELPGMDKDMYPFDYMGISSRNKRLSVPDFRLKQVRLGNIVTRWWPYENKVRVSRPA